MNQTMLSFKRFRHWNSHYICSRIATAIYEKRHPEAPWLTATANQMLETLLKPTDNGLEFGSGRSALWFAKRVFHLTSVEHAQAWFNRITHSLEDAQVGNVRYFLKESVASAGTMSLYSKVIEDFPEKSLDFVLIDGVERDQCALLSITKLVPGGFIIIDDVHRYLPSKSRSPYARDRSSEPASELWHEFSDAIRGWRYIWTSSGVKDTAFFFRPC